MEELLQKIETFKSEIKSAIATSSEEAEAFRIKYLGTKGLVKEVMGEMKNVAAEKKREFGQILNEFKLFAEEKFEELKAGTSVSSQSTKASDLDLSLPGDPLLIGSRHPISLVRNQIVTIFQRLGFAVAEGPEIEDDWQHKVQL